MIACVDVGYSSSGAKAACVVFSDWRDAVPAAEHTVSISQVAEYVPGEFYKRELPCILKVLKEVQSPLTTIVVDAYVWLDGAGRPGLGAYLYEALNRKTAIIGAAKTLFAPAAPQLVSRHLGAKPLYVTAAGMEPKVAASSIRSMHGNFRITTLIKWEDTLSRE